MKVSVLSAVFNEAKYVAEMIESVQAQDHQDWEIVFVDDGSTDSTCEIIRRYESVDSRVRLVKEGVKRGVVEAFNSAYEHCTGDLISLLAGDDKLTPGSLALRVNHHPDMDVPSASFYKLHSFSEDSKYDGVILPKGNRGSRSGAGVTMNRALADIVFPIPVTLCAEDVYMAAIIDDLAVVKKEVPQVIMRYRVHDSNTNPRRAPFVEMNERMHQLNLAYDAVLQTDRLNLSAHTRRRVEQLALAEEMRYRGDVLKLLTRSGLPWVDRLALAAMSSPVLFWVRQRFFGFFSGRRGG